MKKEREKKEKRKKKESINESMNSIFFHNTKYVSIQPFLPTKYFRIGNL